MQKSLQCFPLILIPLGFVLLYTNFYNSTGNVQTQCCENGVAQTLLQQRNSVSQLLNRMRRDMLQLHCEMLQRDQVKTAVSFSGGWCKKVSQQDSSQHVTDYRLAESISAFLKGQRVAGFGDGPGLYKRHHDANKLITVYDAYDGSPYIESITGGSVKFMDLTLPQYGLPLYDWIVCLEVAEHIPHEYQDTFIDNIARHARTGVILSWAHLSQGGLSHVNNQRPEDVERIMLKAGFILDPVSSNLLADASELSWLKDNVRVYRRISSMSVNERDA